jgi:putative inorganic carbon (hco3(-)) transporter
MLLTFGAPQQRIDLLAFGVLAVVGALLWRPTVGPLLIGASLPLYFFSRPLIGPLSVSPPGLALLLSWPAAVIRCRRQLRLPQTPYDAPLSLVLLASLLALLISEYPLLSVREMRALIVEPVLFFWLLAVMPGTARLSLVGFLTTASLVAVVAAVQVLLGIGGTEAEGVRRAQGWYPSPNHLALLLGRAWPFALAAGLVWRPVMLLPAAAIGMAMVLTFSTGGWLGAAAGATVVIAKLGWRRQALAVGGAAAVLLLVVAALGLAGVLPERFNPLRAAGAIRVDLWLSSLAMARDHPLLGVGLDNFTYLYQQVYIRDGGTAEPYLSHPHNWLLHWWLELGVLGLIGFVWFVARFFQLASRRRDWIVAGAAGVMADILVHGLIDQSYFLVDLAYIFWMALLLVARELPGFARATVHEREEPHR